MSSRYTEEEYTVSYKRKTMETDDDYSSRQTKVICGQQISMKEYRRILDIYDDVCDKHPRFTKFSKFNRAASQLQVSADLVRRVVNDREKHGGCHLEQSSYPMRQSTYPVRQSTYPARQHGGWHKEFYGKSISREDYYAILEDVDSTLLRVPTLGIKYAITSAASRLRVSEAIVAAVVQDRQKSIGR